MRIINKIIFGGVMALLLGSFSSCLKNGKYYTDFSNNPASVDLPLAASTNNGLTSFSYSATQASVTLPVYVNLASTNPLSKATNLTLGIDASGLNDYNTANGTDFSVLPDSVYSTSGLSLSIPAGKRLDSATFTINLSKMDLTQAYVLPITITQADVPIEQWNHLFYNIGVKNIYDGHYKVTGNMVDYANAALTGAYPMDVELITSGPNSVQLFDNATGAVTHSIMNGTSASQYGSFGVQFNFDPNTNAVISVVNVYGQPSANGRSGQLDPSGANLWNSSNKSMDVNYWMNQPSVITPHRTSFVEHYTYLGPR